MSNKRRTSTGWLIKETIKGLPEAGKKVGGAIGKFAGKVMKAPFSAASKMGKMANAKREKKLSPETLKKRRELLNRTRSALSDYKKKHPQTKTPRRFKDLEK